MQNRNVAQEKQQHGAALISTTLPWTPLAAGSLPRLTFANTFLLPQKKKGKNPWQRNRGRVSTAANKNKMQDINGTLYREQQIISDIVSFPLGCVHESRRWTLSAVKCALCTVTDSVLSSQGFDWKMREKNASSDIIINCLDSPRSDLMRSDSGFSGVVWTMKDTQRQSGCGRKATFLDR